MQLSNKTYDILNHIHRVAVPVSIFISELITITTLLGDQGILPHAVTITSILAVVQVVIGSVLRISSKSYWDSVEGGEDF